MSNNNRLNKISHVLRQQTSYRKTLLCASTIASLISFPTLAQEQESTQQAKADTEVEVIEVRGLRGTMTRSLNEKKIIQLS